MRYSIGLSLAALLTGVPLSLATAQNLSWSVPVPSPTAASLGKYGDVPVSLYTGLPTITIPLFTAKGKTIDLPISLSYHASGLKVEEIGGWVGMGWTLEAGGVITRTVHGLIDEWGEGYYNTGNTWYNDANWLNPDQQQGLLGNLEANFIDGEPDQFFFNFAGQSGQFVMGPTSTATNSQKIRAIPYRNWTFEFTDAGSKITSWKITTEDGTRYTFDAMETHTDRGTNFNGPLSGVAYASSWYLTEIRAPGGDLITLAYQSYNVTHEMGRSGERWDEGSTLCASGNHFVDSKYDIVSQRLQTITTAQHVIDFSASNLRSDALSPMGAPQEPFLDLITVKTRGNVVLRKFQLQYDNSIGTILAPRLTLKQVTEQDRNGVSLPPHSFEYALPALPARASFAIDHWGYYNGSDTNSSYVPTGTSPAGTTYWGSDRNPNAAFMHAGSLIRITYPTGGFSELLYEPNEYGKAHRPPASTAKKVTAGGLRVGEQRTGDGMGNVTTRKYRYVLASEPDRSSGMIEAVPVYQYFFNVGTPSGLCRYYSRSYMPRIPLGGGSPVVYKEVTVWNGPTGEYGRARHEFYVDDRPPETPVGEVYPFFRHTSLFWRWGDEMRNEEFDSSDRIQRRVLSLPTFPLPTPETSQDFRGLALTSWIPQVMVAWGQFRVESQWKHPSSETITVYDTLGANPVSTSRAFTYGNPKHAQLTEEIATHSDGTQRITRMKYPGDYATGSGNPEAAALTAMQGSAHMPGAVIERTVSEKTATTEKVVQSELTTFRQFLVGQFLPFQRFVLNSPSPIP